MSQSERAAAAAAGSRTPSGRGEDVFDGRHVHMSPQAASRHSSPDSLLQLSARARIPSTSFLSSSLHSSIDLPSTRYDYSLMEFLFAVEISPTLAPDAFLCSPHLPRILFFIGTPKYRLTETRPATGRHSDFIAHRWCARCSNDRDDGR